MYLQQISINIIYLFSKACTLASSVLTFRLSSCTALISGVIRLPGVASNLSGLDSYTNFRYSAPVSSCRAFNS